MLLACRLVIAGRIQAKSEIARLLADFSHPKCVRGVADMARGAVRHAIFDKGARSRNDEPSPHQPAQPVT